MHTQAVTAMDATMENLTLSREEEESLASWYKSADQKLLSSGATGSSDSFGDAPNGEGQVEVA